MNTADNKTVKMNSDVGKLNKIMRYLVDNALPFTVSVVGLVHVALLAMFWLADISQMMIVNAISVAIYIACFIVSRMGFERTVYSTIILEVSCYSIVSTYFIGLRCGTFCFLFSIVPIIIYFGCKMIKGKARLIVVFLLLLNFVTFAIEYIAFYKAEPVCILSPTLTLILVVFSAFVMVFSTMFYNAMYIFTTESLVKSLEQRNEKLSADAHEDALTNLLNRRGFLPLVKSLMHSYNYGRFCIAFCDLDDFKQVNDSFGHEAGDEVLKHVTMLIEQELPGCDICRWGGEEFVILLRNCDMEQAKIKSENLRQIIESKPTDFIRKKINITTTIGLEEYQAKYTEPEAIIKKADQRMYYGKQHGKNVLIFEDAE